VYGEDPSAPADRVDLGARPPWSGGPLSTVNGGPTRLGVPLCASNGGLVVSAGPAWLPALPVASLPGARQASADASAPGAPASQWPGFFFSGITSHRVSHGCPARDMKAAANWIPGQVSSGAPRLATSYDMSVVDQQSGRWYVEDIRASKQSTGVQ
jgi:hypothetical protein